MVELASLEDQFCRILARLRSPHLAEYIPFGDLDLMQREAFVLPLSDAAMMLATDVAEIPPGAGKPEHLQRFIGDDYQHRETGDRATVLTILDGHVGDLEVRADVLIEDFHLHLHFYPKTISGLHT